MEDWEWPDDMSEMESEQAAEEEEEEAGEAEALPGAPEAAREQERRRGGRAVLPLVAIALLLALALAQLRGLPAGAPAQPLRPWEPPEAPTLAPGTGHDEVLEPPPPETAGSPGLPPWAPARESS